MLRQQLETAPSLRFGAVYFPNGAIQPKWWPKGEGKKSEGKAKGQDAPKADAKKADAKPAAEKRPRARVATPSMRTIDEVAAFLGIGAGAAGNWSIYMLLGAP